MIKKGKFKMKKILKTFMMLFVLTCSLVLAGCGMMKGLEKDASVVLVHDDRVVASYTVNSFNNARLTGLDDDQVPNGQKFLGWSVKTDWEYGVDSEDELYEVESIVRYDDIKDRLVNHVFVLHAAFVDNSVINNNYLVIGWYAKTTTSGLDEAIMANFDTALKSYVRTQGATDEDVSKIVIRGYDGAVADIGTAINRDADVDILIGVGNNIDSTGGVTCLEKVADIPMGGKTRYIARLTDKEIVISVFSWLQTAEAQESLQ